MRPARRRSLRRAGIALGAVVAGGGLALWLTPSSSYLLLPDPAHPVAPILRVQGERPDRNGGGIYFVDVIERRASLLERLFPSLRRGSTLVPENDLNPSGLSERARRKVDLRAMARSQDVAAAVALRAAGYRVVVRDLGIAVAAIYSGTPADEKLRAGDVIVALDGRRVATVGALVRKMKRRHPGEVVRLRLRRDGRTASVRLRTIADPDDPERAVIGIVPDQAADIRLPIKVRVNSGNIGGPSAGLAFALDVLEELGRDVDRGHRIAATGALELDGRVLPIGGVRQKVLGAKDVDADVFLVPAGDNAREAARYADGLRVIAVETFQQALRALSTLPPRKHE